MKSKSITLYDNQLVLSIPDSFARVEDTAGYFQSGKPDYLYVEPESKAMISVSLTENQNVDTPIEDRLASYYTLHKRTVPNFSDCKMAKRPLKSGKELGAFQYTSTTVDKTLFNIFVVSCLKNREIIFTMHCNIEMAFIMGQKFMDVMNSIDIVAE